MATPTIHLKINGLDGSSAIKDFKDQIDIDSWSWAGSHAGSMHSEGGGSRGGSSWGDMTFSKPFDASSTKLMLAMCQGKHIPDAVLSVTKSDSAKRSVYIKITMKKVFVTSYQVSSSGGEGGSDYDSFSLNFEEFKAEYWKQGAEGSTKASGEAAWNIRENEPA